MMQVLNEKSNFQCPKIVEDNINQNLNILNSAIYQTLNNPEINNQEKVEIREKEEKNEIKENTETIEKYLPDKISIFKKTLVLDLDETLIHSNFINPNLKCDINLDLNIDNKKMKVNVLIRPGVEEFLEKMSKLYEIVIFTASLSQYAIPLIDKLDKKNICNYRLFRQHCSFVNNYFTKDLKKLNREMNDIIIIDNNPNSYNLNIDNGFPIKTWLDDMNDRELIKIIPYLEFLSDVHDVREFIPKMKDGNFFSYEKADIILNEEKIRKEEEEKEKIKREIEKKERERRKREEEEKLKEKERNEKILELKKIEELRKKNEEMKRRNKIEQEKKLKEIEQSMKEQREKEKNDRINLVQIIDYSNKNKLNQNLRNSINQDNYNFCISNKNPMPHISLNSSINNSLNPNISVKTLNTFRKGKKTLTQNNLLVKKDTPKILINQTARNIDIPMYTQCNTTSKKTFKLKEKISFDDLKNNNSKNNNNFNLSDNNPPQKIKRHMSLRNSRNIHVLYNPGKKLFLKRQNNDSFDIAINNNNNNINNNNGIKNDFDINQRNINKYLDFNDFENEFIQIENK